MKRKTWLMTALLAAALLLTACAQPTPPAAPTAAPEATPAADELQAPKAEYRRMDVAQAKARMDSGDDILVVDVRTAGEYQAGHIPGAILLPNETIGQERPEQLPDLDQEILVYCRSGNRSRQAANALVDMGYTAVYDFGGIGSWPYDVVTE